MVEEFGATSAPAHESRLLVGVPSRQTRLNCVVGSGPAGVSVATALLDAGERVTMLDAALALEPERRAMQRRLQRAPRSEWTADDLSRLRQGMAPTASGVPLKHVYGSDFPYRESPRFVPLALDGVDAAVSFGAGGFSNVWGSAVLPYADRDLQRWPLRSADLAPHYRAVLRYMPISAVHDDLAPAFPVHHDAPMALDPSPQARALLGDLSRRRDALHAAGIRFGQSRIAVAARGDGGACRYCGMCMYGCPDELIYNASATLERLRCHPAFTYVPGVVVERVEERGARVHIDARRLDSGGAERFEGDRVFLACGPIATTRILLESLALHDRTVYLRDSQYFMLPLLRFAAEPHVRRGALHALAQLFVEIDDATVSPNTVHLQIYGYNDLYDVTFQRMLGRAHTLLRIPVDQVVNRMLVIQGYLHSDESPRIAATLGRSANGAPAPLHLSSVAPDRPVHATVRRIARTLRAHRAAFRALPVLRMATIAHPGRGFHTGGSFPMVEGTPSATESDLLGRPGGFTRVHAVDATVFPSIPATTITFTVMANAHRIGATAGAA